MFDVQKESKIFNPNGFNGKRRKQKKIITFDEEKRREFLTGFHKRKLERREKAKRKLEEELKEEKKRLKQEAHERYKKLLYKRPPIEIEEILKENEFETKNHKVSILQLDVAKLNKNHIGQNKINYSESENEEKCDENVSSSDNESEISGFEIISKEKKNTKEQIPITNLENHVLGSKKELKKTLKAAALKELYKSKAFKQKKLLEKQKNKKLSKIEKMRKSKMNKKGKGKKGKAKRK